MISLARGLSGHLERYKKKSRKAPESVDAVYSLGFLVREHKAAKRLFKLLSTGSMCLSTQARTVLIYFARLRVKCVLLGMSFEV
jgi:hypothetical protein